MGEEAIPDVPRDVSEDASLGSSPAPARSDHRHKGIREIIVIDNAGVEHRFSGDVRFIAGGAVVLAVDVATKTVTIE